MLTLDKIKECISTVSEDRKEVVLDTLKGEKCFVKKFTRNDTKEFGLSEDTLSCMVFAGVVDGDGNRLFENVEQVQSMPDEVVAEMFRKLTDHNKDSVEIQAKKS